MVSIERWKCAIFRIKKSWNLQARYWHSSSGRCHVRSIDHLPVCYKKHLWSSGRDKQRKKKMRRKNILRNSKKKNWEKMRFFCDFVKSKFLLFWYVRENYYLGWMKMISRINQKMVEEKEGKKVLILKSRRKNDWFDKAKTSTRARTTVSTCVSFFNNH